MGQGRLARLTLYYLRQRRGSGKTLRSCTHIPFYFRMYTASALFIYLFIIFCSHWGLQTPQPLATPTSSNSGEGPSNGPGLACVWSGKDGPV